MIDNSIQDQILLDATILNTMLEKFSYAFHGMVVRDMEQVLFTGFKTRLGKCNFSIDPGYTINKYATLGENTRHHYGPNYLQDLEFTVDKYGLPDDALREMRARKIWRESPEFTTLLVLGTKGHVLRAGLGDKLYREESTILGGLSKWVHFHLSLMPESQVGFWDTHEEELQKHFVFLQDRRYSRNHSRMFESFEVDEQFLDKLQTVYFIPPANILGFLKVDQEIRRLLEKFLTGTKKELMDSLTSHLGRESNWFYLNEVYRDELPGLALDMVYGLYWGRLIHEFRKIFLSMAIFSGCKLVKVDSPDESWKMQLYDFEDVLHRMISLQNEDSLDDKDYLWYRQSCLRNLSIGLKR